MTFKLVSSYQPAGDQPEAIAQLVDGIRRNAGPQTLLGVTGSGKTFTMANVIQQVRMPTLVMSHNKTLAAQLFQEFREFFPENAVEYFVSFYDYYQPEAYIPSTDTYIDKESMINDEIDRLRLKATSSLLSRRDVIIVASVSCIYGIGSPEAYLASSLVMKKGDLIDRRSFLARLTDMQYQRNAVDLRRGMFRVKGDVIDIHPAYDETALRIETFGDQVESIKRIHPVNGKSLGDHDEITIFPAKHYMTVGVTMQQAVEKIRIELEEQLALLRAGNKLLEAQRLEQRTRYDMEMLREVGYVNGIENYSRILDGREPGTRPYTLIDFFRRPFLTIIDESHVSIPQIQGMYNGDRSRKETLVEHGFRLPCALDNRPLTFGEFESLVDQVVYVSATPGEYELKRSNGIIVEQVIRPTFLVDPPIEIRPAINQVDDLMDQLRHTVEQGSRALVTTLTKKMSEDLTGYLESLDFRVRYLHSEIDTLERTDILRDLRKGDFDILVGINLLREGIDLPEVALVAILDADKEGFLRSARSLVQIAGRAARNVQGRIILYADTVTDSIKKAVDESSRRRNKQLAYNREHGTEPKTVERKIVERIALYSEDDNTAELTEVREPSSPYGAPARRLSKKERVRTKRRIDELEKEMAAAARDLEFEKAARLRDMIASLRGTTT
ncbi:MAG: excinuclease ABC subunit UvrB [Chitinispirillaceae bacterium]|nr:excinuclease ABC subunit UvrB [Chitinispirillaceae bacterium]